jgi:Ca2+-binding RTX toxin-like protein
MASSAATATVDDGSLVLVDVAGERNDVRIGRSGGEVTLRDEGAALTPGTGCQAAGQGQVRCTGVAQLTAALGDGDDTIAVSIYLISNVWGGDGDDRLTTGAAGDAVFGGEGDDTLLTGGGDDVVAAGAADPGNDTIDGAAGSDVFLPGAGADAVRGGSGHDRVSYEDHQAGVTVTLDGAANDGSPSEGDSIASDVEHVVGGGGDDELVGDDGANILDGARGRDRVSGRGGGDTLLDTSVTGGNVFDGGPGNDSISSRQIVTNEQSGFVALLPLADTAACGADLDALAGDFRDAVGNDCESTDRGIGAQPGPVRMTRRGRVSVLMTCGSPQACDFGLRLRPLTGTAEVSVPAGQSQRVVLATTRRGARRVLKSRRVRAQLMASASGVPGLFTRLTVLAPRR